MKSAVRCDVWRLVDAVFQRAVNSLMIHETHATCNDTLTGHFIRHVPNRPLLCFEKLKKISRKCTQEVKTVMHFLWIY